MPKHARKDRALAYLTGEVTLYALNPLKPGWECETAQVTADHASQLVITLMKRLIDKNVLTLDETADMLAEFLP